MAWHIIANTSHLKDAIWNLMLDELGIVYGKDLLLHQLWLDH